MLRCFLVTDPLDTLKLQPQCHYEEIGGLTSPTTHSHYATVGEQARVKHRAWSLSHYDPRLPVMRNDDYQKHREILVCKDINGIIGGQVPIYI
jgi:hypothetical protein